MYECVEETETVCCCAYIQEGSCESVFLRDVDHLCVHRVCRIVLIMLSGSKLSVEFWTGLR